MVEGEGGGKQNKISCDYYYYVHFDQSRTRRRNDNLDTN